MAVSVQKPSRQRKDIFDILVGGLQAASAFTNIQKARAELDNIPEAKARLARQEKQQFTTNFQAVPEGTVGAVELEGPGGNVGLFAPRSALQEQRKLESAAAKLTQEQAGQKFDQEKKLRDKWSENKETKTTQQVSVATGKVRTVANSAPSAAGDLSMVFNYMKILDPGSVVRESEFATAQNATGVPGQVRNVFNRILAGERMNPGQRADFLARAEQLYAVHLDRQQIFNDEFEDLAIRNNLDPQNIVLDLKFTPVKKGLSLPSNQDALDDIKQLNENLDLLRFENERLNKQNQPFDPNKPFDSDEAAQYLLE